MSTTSLTAARGVVERPAMERNKGVSKTFLSMTAVPMLSY